MTGFSGGMNANLGVSAGLAVGGRVRQVYEDLIPTGGGSGCCWYQKCAK